VGDKNTLVLEKGKAKKGKRHTINNAREQQRKRKGIITPPLQLGGKKIADRA